ncbi:MAG: lytic murein transglycosylase [Gammaproteobacteria bacterium]|nr:lytic murein transglycosylase [Gammaproteobacteria bacterium]
MNHFYGKLTTLFLSCAASSLIFANNISVNPAEVKQEKKEFIHQMASQHHFNEAQLTRLFQTQQPNQKIITSMTQPFEKQPWGYYRNFFLTRERITLGAAYLKDHHDALMTMQKKYGIPASVIAAIIGVETEYGTHLGKFSVLNSLYTLGFYYPPREKFFRNELAQYLILTRDNHLNALKIKGSYAGALGIPQFMPSSYRHFGVAYHSGSSVNLFKNDDAIASVANYFHKNGWQANQPIAHQLYSREESPNRGAKLLELPMKNKTQHWEIYKNFNVIMTYNHNVVYAMAVYQLSQAIEKQYAINKR